MKNTASVRVCLCQINPTVGDIKGNCEKIIRDIENAGQSGADIVVFPELALTGYPPEDLLLKKDFVEAGLAALKEIIAACENITAIIGYVNRKDGKLYNSAAVVQNKKLIASYDKICLPNYGVFDEKRYFTPGKEIKIFRNNTFSFGIGICEDAWQKDGPVYKLAGMGADLIFLINASPFYSEKWKSRENTVRPLKTATAYLNLAGGQDELVFDGHSFVMDGKGNIIARAKQFEEDAVVIDITEVKGFAKKAGNTKLFKIKDFGTKLRTKAAPSNYRPLSKEGEIYGALCLGLKDYVIKNGFEKVVLGLSGGIDSALVATIAADVLGKENVKAVFMPSQYTSRQSRDDSIELVKNIGIEFTEMPITDIFSAYLKDLGPHFEGQAPNIAEENLQARIRGNLLMAFSNKFGYLVLATGNKSEVSTGYATLYGDMCGGLSVIKDVPKTMVYKLANYRNSISSVIPQSIIDRPPTAELKPEQKDQDTLPTYDVLDKIIEYYVENDMSTEEIVRASRDLPSSLVEKTISMIDRNEYKRRQSAPGIKITPKAFGKDRRLPITNKYSV